MKVFRLAAFVGGVAALLIIAFSVGIGFGQRTVRGDGATRALRSVAQAQEAMKAGESLRAAYLYGQAVGAARTPDTLFAASEFFLAAKDPTGAVALLEEATKLASDTSSPILPLLERKLSETKSGSPAK